MDFAKEQVISVARLSHLRLSADEGEAVAGDLASILDYVGRLDDLDLDDVEPLFNPAIADENVWREDGAAVQDISEEFLRQAPEVRERYLLVPQVVSSDEAGGEHHE